MAPLIDWTTTGQIFVESLAAGVLIVGAFAVGARLLAMTARPAADRDGTAPASRGNPGAWAGAVVCFLIVAAAVGYGIYFTVDK